MNRRDSIAALLALGATAGPLVTTSVCLTTDFLVILGTATLPLLALLLLARGAHTRLSPATFAAAATLGWVGGFIYLQSTCELKASAPHVLMFHIGIAALCIALGSQASRFASGR